MRRPRMTRAARYRRQQAEPEQVERAQVALATLLYEVLLRAHEGVLPITQLERFERDGRELPAFEVEVEGVLLVVHIDAAI